MVIEFLEILKISKTPLSPTTCFRWISKVIVWAEKTKEHHLELISFEFLKNQTQSNLNSVIEAVNNLKEKYFSNQIFIVYGHNIALRDKVADCLKEFGFRYYFLDSNVTVPVATVLEKVLFEMKKSVFAIVIASADDVGGKDEGEFTKLAPRPRLNVVMELGFGIVLFGIPNTLVLWDEKIQRKELSDYEGYIRIKIDKDLNWLFHLKKNLEWFKDSMAV